MKYIKHGLIGYKAINHCKFRLFTLQKVFKVSALQISRRRLCCRHGTNICLAVYWHTSKISSSDTFEFLENYNEHFYWKIMQPMVILVLLNEISELLRVTSDIVMRYFVHGHGWNCKIICYYLEHAFQINIGIDSFVIFSSLGQTVGWKPHYHRRRK